MSVCVQARGAVVTAVNFCISPQMCFKNTIIPSVTAGFNVRCRHTTDKKLMSCLITFLTVLVKEAGDNYHSQLKESFEHRQRMLNVLHLNSWFCIIKGGVEKKSLQVLHIKQECCAVLSTGIRLNSFRLCGYSLQCCTVSLGNSGFHKKVNNRGR